VLALVQDLPEIFIKGLIGVSGEKPLEADDEEGRVTFGPGSKIVITISIEGTLKNVIYGLCLGKDYILKSTRMGPLIKSSDHALGPP
jgi:hypothetical protein